MNCSMMGDHKREGKSDSDFFFLDFYSFQDFGLATKFLSQLWIACMDDLLMK